METNKVIEEGRVLFTIDPTLYQSRVDALETTLELLKLRLGQFEELAIVGDGMAGQVMHRIVTGAQTRTFDCRNREREKK